MEDILKNENEIKLIKSRIIKELPNINQIIKQILDEIDLNLFNTFDEFKCEIEKELKDLRLENVTNDLETASVEEIDEFMHGLNFDIEQPGGERPSTKGKKLVRAQSIHPNAGKNLFDTRNITGSLQSLTPTTSMAGTPSCHNFHLLNFESDPLELDRTVINKIVPITFNSLIKEDISTNYELELEKFREMCCNLDLVLSKFKMPKEENIKTIIVNPETHRLVAELKKVMKNLISILEIDLNQVNNIFDCESEPFPLYDVLTELYQIL